MMMSSLEMQIGNPVGGIRDLLKLKDEGQHESVNHHQPPAPKEDGEL